MRKTTSIAIAVQSPLRIAPVAENGGVGDQAALGLPQMQLIARRLDAEMQPCPGAQVELDLVRRTRRGAGDSAGKPAIDAAMQVTARNPLDLRVARDDLGKGGRIV